MLLSTVNPAAAAAIGNITKVGIGSTVVYHARAGYMRDRRSSFPAMVMRQHDDGSIDLLVFMEREDFAFEEHIAFRSHNQAHHCWSAVENQPLPDGLTGNPDLDAAIAPLLARIVALENKKGPGRPSKKPRP